MLATIWEHPEIDVSALPTEIRMSLGKLEALADEAARERRTYLAKEPDPEPLSRTLARLHTDISTLGRILTKPLPEAVHQQPDRALVEGRKSSSPSSAADKPSASSPPIASDLGSGDRGHCGL